MAAPGEAIAAPEATKADDSTLPVQISRVSYRDENGRSSLTKGDEEVDLSKVGDAAAPAGLCGGDYIKSFVFGGLDGIVSTFALVAGLGGAKVRLSLLVAVSIAKILADAFSMGFGEFASAAAEQELGVQLRAKKQQLLESNQHAQAKILMDLYRNKGCSTRDALTIVSVLMRNPKAFISHSLAWEDGVLSEDEESLVQALKQGFVCFAAFAMLGAIPLLGFVVKTISDGGKGSDYWETMGVAYALTASTLFVMGLIKSKLSGGTLPQCLKSALLMFINGTIAGAVAFGIGDGLSYQLPLMVRQCNPGETHFCMEVNIFAGITGYYEFKGYEGVSPDLEVKIGETYTFDQLHFSNWMHAVGFSYYPDGAHGADWGHAEREEVETSDLQYLINGESPTCEDAGATGLDCYEPDFFLPRDVWLYKRYAAKLTITKEMAEKSHNGVMYYFCHIHSKMSGKLIILNEDGTRYTNSKPELELYKPEERSEFDKKCGTTGISDYRPGGPRACDTNLLDLSGKLSGLDTDFEECWQAINCQMNTEMTVAGYDYHNDPIATFMQMMVPHHLNAINMAKIMLNFAEFELKTQAGGTYFGHMWAVANVQGFEIHKFMNYLGQSEDYLNITVGGEKLTPDQHGKGADCDITPLTDVAPLVIDPEVAPQTVAAWDGCVPSDTRFCFKFNLLGGEGGYYQVAGKVGDSPDIYMTIGKTYTFDQTEATNWFHPLGFAFYPDGAHGHKWGAREQMELHDNDMRYHIDGKNPSEDNKHWMCYRPGLLKPVNSGMDCYEEEFFYPRDIWMKHKYTIDVTITEAAAAWSQNGELYYFCHIHSKMSGRIILLNPDGSRYTNSNPAQTLYAPSLLGPIDRTCGTTGVEDYMHGGSKECAERHMCGTLDTNFEKCMNAINCKMMQDMRDSTTPNTENKIEVYTQQMTSHHINAVNMARILLKHSDKLQEHPELFGIMNGIVNSQNADIHAFRSYLGSHKTAVLREAALEPVSFGSTRSNARTTSMAVPLSLLAMAHMLL